MAGRRSPGGRACCGRRTDVACAGHTVQRLSEERVHELAEEIWTASTGTTALAGPNLDPRSSQPGASAQAAYRRRREEEVTAWRPGWWRRAGMMAAATIGAGLLTGVVAGAQLGWRMAVLVALLTGWRLHFRPSACARTWRGQAAVQRRTAGVLGPLEQEGSLVLHDITLPGWPVNIDHLVVGSTGVWVIESWQHGGLGLPRRGTSPWRAFSTTTGFARRLRWQVAALASALAGDPSIPVRPLLCVYSGRWSRSRRPVEGIPAATPRELGRILRHASPQPSNDVQRVTDRLLELLRPAA
jgi:hypothetical protein